MNSKFLNKDFLLLLILILLTIFLFGIDNNTGLIDHIRDEIFLKFAYISKIQNDIDLLLEIVKKDKKTKPTLSNANIQDEELFKTLMFYYREKFKQLLELNGLSLEEEYTISRFLGTRRTAIGEEYLLETKNATSGSIVVDVTLKKIVGIVKRAVDSYCIVSIPKDKNFSLQVDIESKDGRLLPAILKGDGKSSFVNVFEDITFTGGKVYISHNHKFYNTLNQLGCTVVGELIPLPVERKGYKSYKVQIYSPISKYLLIVGGN